MKHMPPNAKAGGRVFENESSKKEFHALNTNHARFKTRGFLAFIEFGRELLVRRQKSYF